MIPSSWVDSDGNAMGHSLFHLVTDSYKVGDPWPFRWSLLALEIRHVGSPTTRYDACEQRCLLCGIVHWVINSRLSCLRLVAVFVFVAIVGVLLIVDDRLRGGPLE